MTRELNKYAAAVEAAAQTPFPASSGKNSLGDKKISGGAVPSAADERHTQLRRESVCDR
jgi:hypothetical protein